MDDLILTVGELGASNDPAQLVKTFALGSCVSVIMFDRTRKAIGMAHVALPDSKVNAARAKNSPGYFADTAVGALLERMGAIGCDPGGKGLVAKICGGASILESNEAFQVGRRNGDAIKQVLGQSGIAVVAEDLGGNLSRTVKVSVRTGATVLSSPGRPEWKL